MKVKAEDISYALNFLDDELIAECDKAREEVKVTSIPKKKAKITSFMPFIAAAAALLLIGGVLIAVLPKMGSTSTMNKDSVSIIEETVAAVDNAVEDEQAAETVSEEIDRNAGDDSTSYLADDISEMVDSMDGELGSDYYSATIVPGGQVDGILTSEVHIACSALDDEIYDLVTGLGGREDIEEEYGNTLLSFYVEDVPYGEAVKYDLCEDSDGSSYVFVFEDDDGKRIVPANEDEYELLRQLIDEQAANSILYIYMSEN